jgi:hypothetical protein
MVIGWSLTKMAFFTVYMYMDQKCNTLIGPFNFFKIFIAPINLKGLSIRKRIAASLCLYLTTWFQRRCQHTTQDADATVYEDDIDRHNFNDDNILYQIPAN